MRKLICLILYLYQYLGGVYMLLLSVLNGFIYFIYIIIVVFIYYFEHVNEHVNEHLKHFFILSQESNLSKVR